MATINSILGDTFHRWAALGRFTMIFAFAAASPKLKDDWVAFEKDKKSAPADRGYGPGNPIGAPRPKFTLGKTPNKPPKPGGPANASGTLKSGGAPQAAIAAAPEGGSLPFPPHGAPPRRTRDLFRHRPNGGAGCADGL
jgi:hypothetical protein